MVKRLLLHHRIWVRRSHRPSRTVSASSVMATATMSGMTMSAGVALVVDGRLRIMLTDRGRVNYCVERVLERHPQSLLDIGCGFGFVLAHLEGCVPRLVGVDMNAQGLEVARGAAPTAELVHQTAAELPFPDSSFEVVILSDVLEHVGYTNQSLVVSEAHRVLIPGGQLIVTVPHTGITASLDPMDVKRRFPRAYSLYSNLSGYQPTTDAATGHQHLSQMDLERLLGDSFTIETIGFAGCVEPLFLWLQVAADRILHSNRLESRMNKVRAWESGIRYPRWLAYNARMTCRAK